MNQGGACTGVAVDEVGGEHVVKRTRPSARWMPAETGSLGLSEGVGLCTPCSGETASRSPGVVRWLR